MLSTTFGNGAIYQAWEDGTCYASVKATPEEVEKKVDTVKRRSIELTGLDGKKIKIENITAILMLMERIHESSYNKGTDIYYVTGRYPTYSVQETPVQVHSKLMAAI